MSKEADDPTPEGPTDAQLEYAHRYWQLEKLSQCYDLLAIIAHSRAPQDTRRVLKAHAEGKLVNEPGFRPAD